MIEIRTTGGVSLDLAPDAEFEIEMNNPILESDRIPVAFSTSITFAPSDTNRSVFGYLPAMLLPPSVMKVDATILSGGIPLLSGTLVYDSVNEDGNLVYTFTEKSFDDGLDKRLFELDLPDSRTAGMTADQLANRIRAGNESGVGAPVLYDPDGTVTKFHNLPFTDNRSRFTPCVSLFKLLSCAPNRLDLSSTPYVSDLMNTYVLGLYKSFTGNIKGYGDYLSVAETLPDVTLLDLLKEFCKLTCSFVFMDNGSYVIMPFSLVGISQTSHDWDGKVSDARTFALEKATGYGFGYQKEDGKDNTGIDEEIPVVNTLKGVLDSRRSGYYTPVEYSETGDTYSVPPGRIDLGNNYTVETCELLNFINYDYDVEIEGEKQDNHLSASLIRNVPAYFKSEILDDSYPGGDVWETDQEYYRMTGVVSFPADDGERGSKIILGSYNSGQMFGKGKLMSDAGADIQSGTNLSAYTLFHLYHDDFAAWLAKDRQVISVDLDLSIQDIASFRMWQAVSVRSRFFLVKRLTLGLSVRTDQIMCSAELISL